jgi:hypothetical protein
MSRYKILKMQKPNLIYISFGDPHFCRLTAWKKKQKTIGDKMFCRLKFNRRGYKFPRVKNIWRQK